MRKQLYGDGRIVHEFQVLTAYPRRARPAVISGGSSLLVRLAGRQRRGCEGVVAAARGR